jgi:hypothetical protein
MAVRQRRNALAQTLASRRLPEGVAEPGERVPDALAPEVMPFIRAADEVEPFNPRVAFLCKSRPPTLDGTHTSVVLADLGFGKFSVLQPMFLFSFPVMTYLYSISC